MPGNRSLRFKLYAAPDRKASPQKRGKLVNAPIVVREPTGARPRPRGSTLLSASTDHSSPVPRGQPRVTNECQPDNGLIWVPTWYGPHPFNPRVFDDLPGAAEPIERLFPEQEPPDALYTASKNSGRSLSNYDDYEASEEGDTAILGPSPSRPRYSEDIQSSERIPGQLSLQESCLVRCFSNTLAVHVSHRHRIH